MAPLCNSHTDMQTHCVSADRHKHESILLNNTSAIAKEGQQQVLYISGIFHFSSFLFNTAECGSVISFSFCGNTFGKSLRGQHILKSCPVYVKPS